MPLDLTSFSGALLRHLADFAVYLRDPADKVSLTKAVRNFTSYGEFKDFERKGFELLRLHPNYVLAEHTLTKEVGTKFKILVLIDLGGTVLFRTD